MKTMIQTDFQVKATKQSTTFVTRDTETSESVSKSRNPILREKQKYRDNKKYTEKSIRNTMVQKKKH